MTEEHKQKIRQTHLRLAHGDGWSEEDQEKFERERNTRKCRNYRNRHREAQRSYEKTFQEVFRKRNPYYYGWKQWNIRNHYNQITLEEYINYRKEKEAKKEKKQKEKK